MALLTHGQAETLDQCLASFFARLSPQPSELVCLVDGPGRQPPADQLGPSWRVEAGGEQEGFCSATRRLWQLAAASEADYVFWLENDFVLLEHVDLRPLSRLLDSDHGLVQAQLLRDSVNAEERLCGGVIQKHRSRGDDFVHHDHWVEHWAYLTTNPSLMRREFMAANPWPEETSECEGRFGLALVQRGYRYAIWGDGRPLVRHIGVRRGTGY